MNLLYSKGVKDGDKFKLKTTDGEHYMGLFYCENNVLYSVIPNIHMSQYDILKVLNGHYTIEIEKYKPSEEDKQIMSVCKKIFGEYFEYFYRDKNGCIICSTAKHYKGANNQWCSSGFGVYREHTLTEDILHFIKYDDKESYKFVED